MLAVIVGTEVRNCSRVPGIPIELIIDRVGRIPACAAVGATFFFLLCRMLPVSGAPLRLVRAGAAVGCRYRRYRRRRNGRRGAVIWLGTSITLRRKSWLVLVRAATSAVRKRSSAPGCSAAAGGGAMRRLVWARRHKIGVCQAAGSRSVTLLPAKGRR